MASDESAAKSLSQHSQFGLMSNISITSILSLFSYSNYKGNQRETRTEYRVKKDRILNSLTLRLSYLDALLEFKTDESQ
jgi:hypothetical protein